jgi:tRNA dimethylallyltransferase
MSSAPPLVLPSSFLEMCFQVQKEKVKEGKPRRKRALVLAGPTGVGKSEMALQLAHKIGGEIISADSMQVYRGASLGTSKPTLEEQLLIPHHLVDIKDLNQTFNVVEFYHEAVSALEKIYARGKIPLVVGGSGFYIHTLLYGPPSGPDPDPYLRQRLEEEMEELGPTLLYERLLKADPEYARRVTSGDRHKIMRALEILELSGKKVSEIPQAPPKPPHDFLFRCWFLNRPRAALYERIDRRCERMVEQGLLEEIESLIPRGLTQNPLVSQAIGYRQGLAYLETDRSHDAYVAFMETFKQATRRYAKRQLTWFRREPNFHWLDLETHDKETAVDILLHDFECWQWEL